MVTCIRKCPYSRIELTGPFAEAMVLAADVSNCFECVEIIVLLPFPTFPDVSLNFKLFTLFMMQQRQDPPIAGQTMAGRSNSC